MLGSTLPDAWKTATTPTIYVKKSVKEKSYNDWDNVKSDISITLGSSTQYISRSRDFDMDFSGTDSNVHVWVPTGMDKSDESVLNNVAVQEVSKKYVPSRLKSGESGVDEYVGVLIEAAKGSTIYYQIGESDCYSTSQTTEYDGQDKNLLTGAYDQEDVWQSKEIDGVTYYYYGLKSNKFRLYSNTEEVGWTAYNRAYLKLDKGSYNPIADESSAKELTFTFNFADSTTKIVSAEKFAEQFDGDVIYNLQGQKVTDSYKGVVIKNGKKILNK